MRQEILIAWNRRRWSDEQKLLAVIPNNPSRAIKHPLDKHLYAPTRRMLPQQTQAKSACRHPLREDHECRATITAHCLASFVPEIYSVSSCDLFLKEQIRGGGIAAVEHGHTR
jgi:hypothetical protein